MYDNQKSANLGLILAGFLRGSVTLTWKPFSFELLILAWNRVALTSSPDSLLAVLEAFEPVLNSIDVRTVAVKPMEQDKWQNLVTSVFLSEKTVEEIRKHQEKLPQLCTANLGFFVDAFPYSLSRLQDLVKEKIILRSNGHQTVEKGHIDLHTLGVASFQRSLRGSYQYVLSSSNLTSMPQTEREKLWSIFSNQFRESKRLGRASIHDMAKELLEVDLNDRDRKDFEVGIVIGDFVKIESASFKGSFFELTIKKTPGLKGLQLNLSLIRATDVAWNTLVWRRNVDLRETKGNRKKRFCVTRNSFELDGSTPFDTMNVELIHKPSALTLATTMATAPLRNVVEPLLKTLGAFCPLDEFKMMLLEPVRYGKEPQKTFENAVVWLLSIAGFHSVYLAAKIKANGHEKSFDVLRAVESRFEIGCADIIAYEENEALLLVDCDVGSPDDKKIRKLKATAKFIEKSLSNGKLRIVPVLFSPRDSTELPQEAGVSIVGREAIEGFFKEIAKGNLKKARHSIWYGSFLMF